MLVYLRILYRSAYTLYAFSYKSSITTFCMLSGNTPSFRNHYITVFMLSENTYPTKVVDSMFVTCSISHVPRR